MPDDEYSAEPEPDILDQLTALLPENTVNVRQGRATSPYVRSLAVGLLSEALTKGHTIDRSNEDGPLAEWDGWLVIDTPILPTYLQTNFKL